jgi:hypothetical protein
MTGLKADANWCKLPDTQHTELTQAHHLTASPNKPRGTPE